MSSTRQISHASSGGEVAMDAVGGSFISGPGIAVTYDDAANTTTIASTGAQAATSGIVTGGQVVWETGYTFRVSAAEYVINGTYYTSIEQTVTLAAADGSNDRIDVIYLDTAGLANDITGTAAALPTEPDIDPSTQIKLTFVLVPTSSSSPTGVANTNIYLENTEWTSATSGSGFNAASTTNPYAGTKDIEGTAVANGAYVSLVAGAPLTLDSMKVLAMFVRSKAAWAAGRVLRAQWYLAGVAKGVPVTIASGYWGFDSSITSGYQQVAIPIAQFVLPAATSVDRLRITDSGGSIGFYIDNIILQAQSTSLSQGGDTYLTQAQGDARYHLLSTGLASTTQTAEQISGFIASPSDKSYTLALKMAHSGTITECTTKSVSGTCTATFKVNSTALGGTANSVSSSEQSQAHSSTNTFVAGDDIVLTVSSNSSCVDMAFSIKYTRTLS